MSIIEPEASIWYTCCVLVVLVRLVSRRIHHGAWKNLQADDYIVILGLMTDTVVYAVMHIVVRSSSNLIAPQDDASQFTAQEIASRVYGSKLVLVVEQMQIATTWLMKAALLLMYQRMTILLPQHLWVKVTVVYVALGFVVMEILYFGVWCRPFNQYWAVPPNSSQCNAATNHLITNAVFNISSDLMIIAIPLPLLWQVRIPRKNKFVLMGIFMIGLFTISAAIMNKYYSFRNPFGTEWTIWYLRESFTAILCANLPLTYPLVQRVFKLRNWSAQSYGGGHYTGNTKSRAGLSVTVTKSHTVASRAAPGDFDTLGMPRAESQERINSPGAGFGNQVFITSAIEMDDFSSEEHDREQKEGSKSVESSRSRSINGARDNATPNYHGV